MSKVIQFPGETCADWPADVVLEKAKDWGMEHCVVLGLDKDGKLQFGGSTSDSGTIMMMLEAAKIDIVKRCFE